MRTDLDHLPQSRQRELGHVARVLIEEFEAAHALGNQKWKKAGRIFKLVLYGSFARGDWVDDPIGGYQSDYDILIVVNDERLLEFEYWSAAEDRLMRDTTITKALSAPVNFIVHTRGICRLKMLAPRRRNISMIGSRVLRPSARMLGTTSNGNGRRRRHSCSTKASSASITVRCWC